MPQQLQQLPQRLAATAATGFTSATHVASGRSFVLAALLVAACAAPAVVLAQSRAVTPGQGSASAPAAGAASGGAIAPLGAPAPRQSQSGAGSIQLGAAPSAAPTAGQPMPSPKPVAPAQAQRPSPRIDLVNEQLEANAPMTPAQIARLKAELDRRTQAMGENSTASDPLAKPTQAVYQIDLSPRGAYTPPIVRITPGQGSVVTFVDQAGKPWPITVADNAGDEAGITVQQFSTHQLSIFAKNKFAKGNVLVGLKGLTAPVTFTTMTGQKAVDYSVTLIIPRLQEGSVPSNVGAADGQPSLASSDLFDYLLGTPPAKARQLKVTGMSDTQAWQVGGDKLIVRSPALITGCLRSFKLDDMGVCELPIMPVVLGTMNGRYVQGQIGVN